MGRREARQNRIIMWSVIALLAVILLILAAGIVIEVVVKPAAAVATVNGTKIRTDEYQTMLTYQRYNLHSSILDLQNQLQTLDPTQEGNEFLVSFYQQQLQQLQSSLVTVPQDALETMIENKLIQEKAEEEGITVTPAEVEQTIDDELRQAFSSQTPLTGTEEIPTPTPIPDSQIDELYDNVIGGMGLSDKEFRSIVRQNLYRSKLEDHFASQVVTTGLVIHVQLIETESEEAAADALTRIELGEDFTTVAEEVSLTPTTVDLGWVAAGQLSSRYGQEVEDAAFDLEVGDTTQVTSNERFFVIQVLERDENGPLPDDVVSTLQSTALTDWLADRMASPETEIERLLAQEDIPPDPFATAAAPLP